jgi:hypothetical protein
MHAKLFNQFAFTRYTIQVPDLLAGCFGMIQITPRMRVLVAIEPVGGRKGIDSLARLCQEKPAEDPFQDVFSFSAVAEQRRYASRYSRGFLPTRAPHAPGRCPHTALKGDCQLATHRSISSPASPDDKKCVENEILVIFQREIE